MNYQDCEDEANQQAAFSKEMIDEEQEEELGFCRLNPHSQEDSDTDSEPSRENASEDEASQHSEEATFSSNFEIISNTNDQIPTLKADRISMAFLTKYEKAKIISLRSLQISNTSDIFISIDQDELSKLTPLEIAEKELQMKAIPFIVRRVFPDGSFEDWPLSELSNSFFELQNVP